MSPKRGYTSELQSSLEKTVEEWRNCMEAVKTEILHEEKKMTTLDGVMHRAAVLKQEMRDQKSKKMEELRKFEGLMKSIHAPGNSKSKADKGLAESSAEVLRSQIEELRLRTTHPRNAIMPAQASSRDSMDVLVANSTGAEPHPNDYRFDFGAFEGEKFKDVPDWYLRTLAGQESVFRGQHEGLEEAFDYHRPDWRNGVSRRARRNGSQRTEPGRKPEENQYLQKMLANLMGKGALPSAHDFLELFPDETAECTKRSNPYTGLKGVTLDSSSSATQSSSPPRLFSSPSPHDKCPGESAERPSSSAPSSPPPTQTSATAPKKSLTYDERADQLGTPVYWPKVKQEPGTEVSTQKTSRKGKGRADDAVVPLLNTSQIPNTPSNQSASSSSSTGKKRGRGRPRKDDTTMEESSAKRQRTLDIVPIVDLTSDGESADTGKTRTGWYTRD